jgi:hypothetical protein
MRQVAGRFSGKYVFEIGRDFASTVGVGAWLEQNFTCDYGPKYKHVTLLERNLTGKWIDLYNRRGLEGTFDLYVHGYDVPRLAIQKGCKMYYALRRSLRAWTNRTARTSAGQYHLLITQTARTWV